MNRFTPYALNEQLRQEMKLPDLPFPVREDRAGQIFGGEGVRFESLLDELEVFLLENPQLRESYGTTIAALSYYVGVMMGRAGLHDGAAHYLEMGVRAQPRNVELRANLAVALQSLGDVDEALGHLETVIHDPAVGGNPIVWMLAARLYVEKGDHARALPLLKAMARTNPPEFGFWDFLAKVDEKVNGPRSIDEVEEADDGPTCAKCKTVNAPGKKFCGGCGASLAPKPAPAGKPPVAAGKPPVAAGKPPVAAGKPPVAAGAPCPYCGVAQPPEQKFCDACGKSLAAAPATCPACRAPLKPGKKFCSACGARI